MCACLASPAHNIRLAHVMVDKTRQNRLATEMRAEAMPDNFNNDGGDRNVAQFTTTPTIVEVTGSPNADHSQTGRVGQLDSTTALSTDYSVQSPR